MSRHTRQHSKSPAPAPDALLAFVHALAKANFLRDHPELVRDLGHDEHYDKTGRDLRSLFER
jgi:hypothetical protein